MRDSDGHIQNITDTIISSICRFEQFITYMLPLVEGDGSAKKSSGAMVVPFLPRNPRPLEPLEKEYNGLADEFCRGGATFGRAAVIMLAAGYLELIDLFSIMSSEAGETDGIVDRFLTSSQRVDNSLDG